jgi:hypothetical protein
LASSAIGGRLVNFGGRQFPWFGWDVEPGLEHREAAPTPSGRTTMTFKTCGLWEGAGSTNWNVGWAYNRTDNIQTDSTVGIPTIEHDLGECRLVKRTLPDFLFLSSFKTVWEVSKRYAELNRRVDTGVTRETNRSSGL